MPRQVLIQVFILIALVSVVLSAALAAPALDRSESLATSQAVIGKTLDDFSLLDRDSRPVSLATLAGKPLLVSVVYTACVHACSVSTRHLDRAVQQARSALGDDAFNVVTIGFDVPVDRPETMREYARRHAVRDPNWQFLSSPDAVLVERLLTQLGFSYAPSAQGYDHVVQVTLLDGGLRIYRQVYGETFDLPHLIEPLKDLVWGRPPSEQSLFQRLLNRIRLLCTVYDTSGERYVFDYSLFVGLLIGALVIGLGLIWLAREAVRTRVAR